jgi:ABC-type Fe3+ transport system permease subunit
MDKRLRKIAYWRPRPPIVTWLCAAIPMIFGLAPFLGAMILFLTRTPSSSPSPLSTADLGSSEWLRVTIFTVWQAFITTITVTFLAPLLALALTALSQPLRQLSIAFRTLMYTLPATIIATGLIIAWGKSGILTVSFANLGMSVPIWTWLYSPWGLILVNITMNLPFASVLLYRTIVSIPSNLWDSAAMIGLGTAQSLRAIYLPAIRTPLQLITLVTFSLSMGTFGAVAILGGGPASQTLEMSTYIALFTFGHWNSAACFAMTHALINAALVIGVLIRQRDIFRQHVSEAKEKPQKLNGSFAPKIFTSKAIKMVLIGVNLIFDVALATPIFAVLYDASTVFFMRESSPSLSLDVFNFLTQAALTSLKFAIPVAILTTLSCWILSRGYFASVSHRKSWVSTILLNMPMIGAMIPGMALGFGYWTISSLSGFPLRPDLLTIPILTALTMPFVIPLIFPSFASRVHPHDDLRSLNGIPTMLWLKIIEGPAMIKPLIVATVLALILTVNETSVVTVLRPPEDPALSTALIALMGRYKFSEAAIGASILIFFNFLFIAFAMGHKEGSYG